VQSKIVEFWDDSKDIKIAIANKLGQLARREDLIGWVRAHQEANLPALSNEIARLSKENAELRNQLGARPEAVINGLSYSQIKALLQKRGLWDFVKTQRNTIRSNPDRRQVSEVSGLADLGLMEQWQLGYENFVLTDAGRMLLNNIEFEELSLPSAINPAK
jgi:hypothetical protein